METRSVVLEEHVDSEYEPTEQEILDYSEWLGMDLENDKDLMWIARAGLKVPLPPPWKPCTTGEENEVFYFNFDTGESVWDHPCDEYHRMLYKKERAKKYGLSFDEAALEDLAHRLGLSNKEDDSGHHRFSGRSLAPAWDMLDESGSMGRSASASGGVMSLSGGDTEKKKKKKDKKEKKSKKEKSEEKDEVRLEAPKTLAPLSARGVPARDSRPDELSQLAEDPPPSTDSSRAPSQSLSEEDRRDRPEDPKMQPASRADGPPRPAGGAPPPPIGDPPEVKESAAAVSAEASDDTASPQQLDLEKRRLEELYQKNVAALQAEHKAKLAKHRRELQDEFGLERDRTFSELQEKHDKQVREERARLQQELVSKKGKMKEEIEATAKSEEELQKKLSESQAEATRLRSEAASLARKCSAYEERVRRLEEDMKECRKEVSLNRTNDAREVTNLKAQLEAKNVEIEQIKAGAAAASERLGKWEEEMQRLQDLAQDNDEAKARIQQLMHDLEVKETQRAALEQQIKEDKGSSDKLQELQEAVRQKEEELSKQKAKVSSLEASLMNEVEAKSKLQAKLSEMQSDLAKASGNKAQLDELRRELDLRTEELSSARKASATDAELKQARDALEEEKRLSSQASTDATRINDELAALKAELAEEREASSNSKAQVAAASREASRLQALLDQQAQQALDAEQERCRLQQQVADEKIVSNQAQAEFASIQHELAISKGALTAREGECKRLQDKIGDAVGQHEELRRLQTNLEQANARSSNLKTELDARTADLVQLRAEVQQQERQAALRAMEEASLKAEVDTWRTECSRLQNEASQSEVPKMQALLEEEKAGLNRIKAEAAEAMAQCKAQAAASAAELEVRSKECGRLRAELRACRPSGGLAQDEVRELVSLRAKVLDLEAEVETLQQKVKLPNVELEDQKLRSLVKERDETILRLRGDLAHAVARHSKELEELQLKVNEARMEERQLRHDDNGFVISDLKAQLRSKASEVEQLHSEVRSSVSELERVRAEARHAEARAAAREISSVEAAKAMVTDDWKREVDRLQVELQTRAAESAASKEKAERLAREVRRVQQEESRVAKSQEALRGELEQAQDHNRAIREEVADAEHRCEDARAAVRAERSSRTHAETQVREYQRDVRALKSQLQEQVAEAEKFRIEARKKYCQLEDKELEVSHLQDQVQFLENQLRARRDWGMEKEEWEEQMLEKDGPMDITGLKTAVELSQLSQAQGMGETGDPDMEEQDATLSPCDAMTVPAGSPGPPPDSPVRQAEDVLPAAAWQGNAQDQQAEVGATSPQSQGAAATSAGPVPEEVAAFLQMKRAELQAELLTVDKLRQQWKQDADRLRSVGGMAREQALLAEARAALDDRASAIQRAMAEHSALEQALQAGAHDGDCRALPRTSPPALGIRGNPMAALKARSDAGDTPRSSTGGQLNSRHGDRDKYPTTAAEDLSMLRRWQHLLGRETVGLGCATRLPLTARSRSGGYARSISPFKLDRRRSRVSREAVDYNLNQLYNFLEVATARPLSARAGRTRYG